MWTPVLLVLCGHQCYLDTSAVHPTTTTHSISSPHTGGRPIHHKGMNDHNIVDVDEEGKTLFSCKVMEVQTFQLCCRSHICLKLMTGTYALVVNSLCSVCVCVCVCVYVCNVCVCVVWVCVLCSVCMCVVCYVVCVCVLCVMCMCVVCYVVCVCVLCVM